MKESQIEALAGSVVYNSRKLCGTVEETHISWVILTPRYAFKIKKPLKLSFLDFSTLTKRRRFCEKELMLNRRFSRIYLRVLPVRLHRDVWRLGDGDGRIVDYAVMMRRLDTTRRMDVLLKGGRVRKAHVLALAERIAAFHRNAEVIHRPFTVDVMSDAFNDLTACRRFVRQALPDKFFRFLMRSVEWSKDFLKTHEQRLKERVRLGFQRDVHGDLHSGNIFLQRIPEIFDCIEFNDRYRQIDVLNDVAFFCMDLEYYGEKALAEFFLQHYRRRFPALLTREDEDLFVYFKCYRANVRAKVHALAAQQEHDPKVYRIHRDAVKNYLLLMKTYMEALGGI